MPVVHQEIDAVIFGSDGIRIRFRYALQDLRRFHVNFKSALRARLRPYLPGDDQRGLLGQTLQRLKQFLGQIGLYRDALNDPRPIAKQRKTDLAGAPNIV